MAIGDQVGKQTVDELTKQTIPELSAAAQNLVGQLGYVVNSLLLQVQVQILPKVQEIVNQSMATGNHDLHGVLDRLNNTKIVVSSFSVMLQIPPKKG